MCFGAIFFSVRILARFFGGGLSDFFFCDNIVCDFSVSGEFFFLFFFAVALSRL